VECPGLQSENYSSAAGCEFGSPNPSVFPCWQ
jgi:hypothetical protein